MVSTAHPVAGRAGRRWGREGEGKANRSCYVVSGCPQQMPVVLQGQKRRRKALECAEGTVMDNWVVPARVDTAGEQQLVWGWSEVWLQSWALEQRRRIGVLGSQVSP